MFLKSLFLWFSLGATQYAFALAGYVGIETHMEHKGESKMSPYSERCQIGEPGCSQDYVGSRIISPVYPSKMLKKHRTATCIADISISAKGMVSKVNDVICKPSKSHFLISVRNAVKQYTFEPRLVDGKPVPVMQALIKFSYEIK